MTKFYDYIRKSEIIKSRKNDLQLWALVLICCLAYVVWKVTN